MNTPTPETTAVLKAMMDALQSGCSKTDFGVHVIALQRLCKKMESDRDMLIRQLWKHAERLEEVEMAAQAVVDRWETPHWKDAEPTAAVIYKLRDILANVGIGKTDTTANHTNP